MVASPNMIDDTLPIKKVFGRSYTEIIQSTILPEMTRVAFLYVTV